MFMNPTSDHEYILLFSLSAQTWHSCLRPSNICVRPHHSRDNSSLLVNCINHTLCKPYRNSPFSRLLPRKPVWPQCESSFTPRARTMRCTGRHRANSDATFSCIASLSSMSMLVKTCRNKTLSEDTSAGKRAPVRYHVGTAAKPCDKNTIYQTVRKRNDTVNNPVAVAVTNAAN